MSAQTPNTGGAKRKDEPPEGACPCLGLTCANCVPDILKTLHQEGYRPVHVNQLTRGWR